MSLERVPIENMPKNICTLLDKNDYLYALFHPDGFDKGAFDVIHMNAKYPKWQNIIMNANRDDGIDKNIVAYTRNGWEVIPFSLVHPTIIAECLLCFAHLIDNKDKMWPQTYQEDDDDVAKICELITKRTPEEEVCDSVMRALANTVGRQIRKGLENK